MYQELFDWGSQRVKGLSIVAVVRDMLMKKLGLKGKGKVQTSLIEEFIYPKYGPGQLWEITAARAEANGAEIETDSTVVAVNIGEDRMVRSITVRNKDGEVREIDCDYFISSLPIKDLINAIKGMVIPEDVQRIAGNLPYRDFITVGLLVPRLKIKNTTKLETVADRIPDTWIYVQEREVKLGRNGQHRYNNMDHSMLTAMEASIPSFPATLTNLLSGL